LEREKVRGLGGKKEKGWLNCTKIGEGRKRKGEAIGAMRKYKEG